MINLPGQLTIRTINGRNGDFNVGRLSTSIGEFVIKDALLDQYNEGSTAVILSSPRYARLTTPPVDDSLLRSGPSWTA